MWREEMLLANVAKVSCIMEKGKIEEMSKGRERRRIKYI
jgi:hypothetical protein